MSASPDSVTFRQIYESLNQAQANDNSSSGSKPGHAPLPGDDFIIFCQKYGNQNGRNYGTVNLDSTTYGPPPNNHAVNWLKGYTTIHIGEGFARFLKYAIEVDGKYTALGVTGAGTGIAKFTQQTNSAINSATGGLLGSGQAVAAFLTELSSASLWIRVAEVVIGLGLIIVGLAKLTQAGQIAKKAATVAATTGLV